MNEFEVWNEVTWGGGAANFITGCGGFLQMIVMRHEPKALNYSEQHYIWTGVLVFMNIFMTLYSVILKHGNSI